MARVLCFTFVADLVFKAAQYEQCRDPLYETHWAGKNDIPTLTGFPTVNTNLRLCPSYNEKASCCQQGFETEQLKYFEFWRTVLQRKFWRVYAHRYEVLAASSGRLLDDVVTKFDREQLDVVTRTYQTLLSPATQQQCLTGVLTYAAGMMCFSCKPEWFQYSVLVSQKMTADRLLRVRMAASVCVELWAACSTFGAVVAKLRNAIRDSRLARSVPRAEESFDMFLSQRQLCNWAHNTIALHPFKQPNREEQEVPTPIPVTVPPPIDDAGRRLDTERSLNVLHEDLVDEDPMDEDLTDQPLIEDDARRLVVETKRILNVMDEGRASGFSMKWKGLQMISHASRTFTMALTFNAIFAVVLPSLSG